MQRRADGDLLPNLNVSFISMVQEKLENLIHSYICRDACDEVWKVARKSFMS